MPAPNGNSRNGSFWQFHTINGFKTPLLPSPSSIFCTFVLFPFHIDHLLRQHSTLLLCFDSFAWHFHCNINILCSVSCRRYITYRYYLSYSYIFVSRIPVIRFLLLLLKPMSILYSLSCTKNIIHIKRSQSRFSKNILEFIA